ncbi:T9SS type A sorting domain-containing protein [Xanthomarina spongicola]|uniref:Putative secreted protein (Por secretion system target) n=1 Tax=Xanthomarina spongicola TaxID=570520 RepID=A0A316DL89_9FLAO|nr:T9SS type A sorting domain-containing protein [Xanthomarina spongicola]PWK18967.1 putative secreted protein (Por secretion system target) [Xanthomarina spongicola]
MKKTTYLMAICFAFYSFTYAQYTPIPDANFELELIADGIDSDPTPDGQILTADAAGHTGELNVAYKNISDFTGVEAFVAIDAINVNGNLMTSIDVTNSPNLTRVRARSCSNLTNINVTGLVLVNEMDFGSASLSSLSVVTNTALVDLDVRNCDITTLDLSQNLAISIIDVKNNGLTFLDMRNGNNAATSFVGDFNPGLECIFVDDASEPNLSSWTIDANSNFVETVGECNSLSVDNANELSFSMYPNPTRNTLYVDAKTNNSIINIYNITGKIVLTKTLIQGNNLVDVSRLASGIYLARFSSDNQLDTKKLIIK